MEISFLFERKDLKHFLSGRTRRTCQREYSITLRTVRLGLDSYRSLDEYQSSKSLRMMTSE